MLTICDLVIHRGGRTLLDGVSLSLPTGTRCALIGRNGSGKTSLLNVLAGRLHPDGGSVEIGSGARVGMVAQDAPSGLLSLRETVLAADTERAALLVEAETATDPERIAFIHIRLADIDASGAPARAARILAGLGFDEETQNRPVDSLSGGWRMRVALAALLFRRPEILLLDEPTNHLDLEASIWLESFLKSYPNTLILVSHDRDLLNSVPAVTLHLDGGQLVRYRGGYDAFTRVRAERMAFRSAQASRVDAERKRIQGFVDRFRVKATKARQAQSRIKMLEKLTPISLATDVAPPRFDFPKPSSMAPPMMTLEGVATGYDGRPVLRRLDLRLDPDDRIALIGANGNGKSTLLKLLAGQLAPLDGILTRARGIEISHFTQHRIDAFDGAATPITSIARLMPNWTPEKVRTHLGRFGLGADHAETRVADLSGGEKARLGLAAIARRAPHILLLDEPTNHLDIDSRAALIDALNAYDGAVVVASHDQHLIETVCECLWLVDDGTVRPYDGDLADYRDLVLATERKSAARRKEGGGGRRSERQAAAQRREKLAPLKKKAGNLETAVMQLTRLREVLESQLSDPGLYDADDANAHTEIGARIGQVRRQIEQAEESWLEALATLEAARNQG